MSPTARRASLRPQLDARTPGAGLTGAADPPAVSEPQVPPARQEAVAPQAPAQDSRQGPGSAGEAPDSARKERAPTQEAPASGRHDRVPTQGPPREPAGHGAVSPHAGTEYQDHQRPPRQRPPHDNPAAHEPTAHEPTAHEPTAHEPTAHEPTAHEPGPHPPADSATAPSYAEPAPVRDALERLQRLAPDDPERLRLREQVVESHLPLVRVLAQRYRDLGEPLDDLVQVGTIGLIHAVDRFDPDRGTGLASYATPNILGEIRRHFRDRAWAVRVPRRLQELQARTSAARENLAQRLGRSPTVAELAQAMDLEEEAVLEGLEAQRAYAAVPLERPEGQVAVDGALVIVDSGLEDVVDRESLRPVLRSLPSREKRILALRYFRGLSQAQIAEELGISQMHVSRLLARTLSRLQQCLADAGEAPRDARAATDRPSPQSAASQPAASQPTASQPTASQPAASQPTASQPAASQPAASQPTTPQPGRRQPGSSRPAGPQPAQPTSRRTADAGPAQGPTAQPGAARPQAARPQTAQPQTARPEPGQRQTPQPPTAQPDRRRDERVVRREVRRAG